MIKNAWDLSFVWGRLFGISRFVSLAWAWELPSVFNVFGLGPFALDLWLEIFVLGSWA
jgi:hypothetical protein